MEFMSHASSRGFNSMSMYYDNLHLCDVFVQPTSRYNHGSVVKRGCRKISMPGLHKVSDPLNRLSRKQRNLLLSHLLYDDDMKVIYCAVPKIGQFVEFFLCFTPGITVLYSQLLFILNVSCKTQASQVIRFTSSAMLRSLASISGYSWVSTSYIYQVLPGK